MNEFDKGQIAYRLAEYRHIKNGYIVPVEILEVIDADADARFARYKCRSLTNHTRKPRTIYGCELYDKKEASNIAIQNLKEQKKELIIQIYYINKQLKKLQEEEK